MRASTSPSVCTQSVRTGRSPRPRIRQRRTRDSSTWPLGRCPCISAAFTPEPAPRCRCGSAIWPRACGCQCHAKVSRPRAASCAYVYAVVLTSRPGVTASGRSHWSSLRARSCMPSVLRRGTATAPSVSACCATPACSPDGLTTRRARLTPAPARGHGSRKSCTAAAGVLADQRHQCSDVQHTRVIRPVVAGRDRAGIPRLQKRCAGQRERPLCSRIEQRPARVAGAFIGGLAPGSLLLRNHAVPPRAFIRARSHDGPASAGVQR